MSSRCSLLHLLVFGLAWTQIEAHGGKSLKEELHAREVYAQNNKMDLSHCADKFERDGLFNRALERRVGRWNILRRRGQGLEGHSEKREPAKFFDFASHDFDVLSTRSHGCVLHPELTEGPYYVEGEKIRDDLIDGQKGALFVIDLQIVDSHSCEPVEDVYVELWYTNATGVYSGIVAEGNGSGEDDPHNARKTFNRGVQKTDKDGVVFFTSIFPGHYSGRTPHVHVMTHIKPKVLPDGSIMGNKATHIGQLFFDQRLIRDVEELPVYRTNKQPFIMNAEDYYFREALKTSNPVMQWLKIKWPGHENAVLGWMPIGVNMSNVREAYVAATLEPKANH